MRYAPNRESISLTENRFIGLLILSTALIALSSTYIYSLNTSYECEGCNIILVSVEPWNAEHAGFNGYEKNITPNMDRLANRSLVFRNAYSTSGHTTVSTFSTFTSLYPPKHGVVPRNASQRGSNSNFTMLAEVLDKEGYSNIALTDGMNVRGELGFQRGFDKYNERGLTFSNGGKEELRLHKGNITSSEPLDIENLFESKDKTFLYYQSFAPHSPYGEALHNKSLVRGENSAYSQYLESILERVQRVSPENRRSKKRQLMKEYHRKLNSNRSLRRGAIRTYDRIIRRQDRIVGEIVGGVQRAGEMDDTVIIIMSQHGEHLGEKGRWGHGGALEDVIQVPLMVYVPDKDSKAIDEYVSTVDLAPTVLDILKIENEAFENQTQGTSLMSNEGLEGRRYIYAGHGDKTLIDTREEMKYLRTDEDKEGLFNLSDGSNEGVRWRNEEVMSWMREEFRRFYAVISNRSLGYGSVYPYYAK